MIVAADAKLRLQDMTMRLAVDGDLKSIIFLDVKASDYCWSPAMPTGIIVFDNNGDPLPFAVKRTVWDHVKAELREVIYDVVPDDRFPSISRTVHICLAVD